MVIQRYAGGKLPYSKSVRAGNFLYVSGQIPVNEEGKIIGGSIKEQTQLVMENLQKALLEAGYTFKDVVKTTCWLTNQNQFGDFNEVYLQYVSEALPARACVITGMVAAFDVEVEAVAYANVP